ncbi:TPA: omptin family outer membrane protease [Escherichia coli]
MKHSPGNPGRFNCWVRSQHFKMPYIGLTSNYLYDSFEFGRR